MSPFKVIEWIVGLVPKAVEAVGSLSRAARSGPKPKASTWNRPHFWCAVWGKVLDSDGVPHQRIIGYDCPYCGQKQDETNRGQRCPGPKLEGER